MLPRASAFQSANTKAKRKSPHHGIIIETEIEINEFLKKNSVFCRNINTAYAMDTPTFKGNVLFNRIVLADESPSKRIERRGGCFWLYAGL